MNEKDLNLFNSYQKYVKQFSSDTGEKISRYNQLMAQYAEQIARLEKLYQVENDILPTLSDTPPEPKYSGKITTRIAPHVHEQAAKLAEEQGVSLNQYINDAIVALNNQLLGIRQTAPEILQMTEKLRQQMEAAPTHTSSEAGTISGTFCFRPPVKEK